MVKLQVQVHQVQIPVQVKTKLIIIGMKIAAAGRNLAKNIIVNKIVSVNDMVGQAKTLLQMHQAVNQ